MEESKTFVGIDNSHETHTVTIINEKGAVLKSFTVFNSYQGFQELDEVLKTFPSAPIAFEIAQGPLVDFLRSHQYTLYSLNPLMVKRFKQTYFISGNKNDSIDSKAIALYLKTNINSIRNMTFSTPEIEMLKHFTTIHEQITKNHSRMTLQLIDAFKLYFPLYAHLFSRYTLPIVSHMVLQYPTWKDLKNTSDADLKIFLFKHHYPGRFINMFIRKIREYDQVISTDVEIVYSIKAVILAKAMLDLNKGLDAVEANMNSLAKKNRLYTIFMSLPGAGKILGPKILAAFGDNKEKFSNYNAAQCYFGTSPKNYQSGKIHRVSMRKSCNKRFKNVFFQFSFTSLSFSKWARLYYDKQRSRGKTHSMALRALSNKWVKVIYYLWVREAIYSENIRKLDQINAVA